MGRIGVVSVDEPGVESLLTEGALHHVDDANCIGLTRTTCSMDNLSGLRLAWCYVSLKPIPDWRLFASETRSFSCLHCPEMAILYG
jgi:hypothetical protein